MDFSHLKPPSKKLSAQVLAVGELSKKIILDNEIQNFSEIDVKYAPTTAAAVELVSATDFAAVMLGDHAQNEILQVIRKMRSLKPLVPLILVHTGTPDENLQIEAFEAGATDVISTEISHQILYAKIRYAIDLHRAKSDQLDLQVGLSAAKKAIEKNEEKLEFALSSAKMGMWTVGLPSGNVILSEEAREIFGFAKTYDHSDAAIDEFIHPDYRERAREVLANAIATRTFYNDEYQIVRPDGELRWINARGKARYDKDGNPSQLSGLIWDITDRKNAEINLKALELRFLRSTEATDLGVWYCNLPFDELIWNKEVKGHFFLAPDARVTIHTFYDMIHPDDREPTRQAIEKSIATKTPYNVVYRTVDPKNSQNIKYIRAIGWTDYNESGQPIRFDGITLDVSREREYEEELRAAKNAAEKANELKSAFLANMSHEIRTPLGAMIGFADLLKDSELTEEERITYANVITRNGQQLSAIINDILDISKVESGQFTVESLEVDPRAIAEEVVSLLSLQAKEKGISIRIDVSEKAPDHIVTDPLRLRQILTNIVGNAVKFTQEGEVRVSVLADNSSSQKPFVCFRIEDTGDGIAPSDQKKLLQVFSQADDSVTRKFGGTGLGLALSRKLAQALEGDVILEHSEKGKGSSFLVTIASGILTEAERSRNKLTEATIQPKLDGLHVLLIEDTPDNQELISTVLKVHNVKVEIAGEGKAGIDKALDGHHDLVLMDLQMPVMDGYTATKKLREQGYRKPIIALSAHAMNEVRMQCLSVGCTDYLTKPINFTELIQAVGKHAGR